MGQHDDAPRSATAFTTIDLDGPGRQTGFVMIPHSPHEDAWGATRIPIAVIANGDGPTVILEAGNHGDEYEGQIVIGELIRELDPSSISGRLILMPANNVHAVMAGRRTSPVDGLNFNRSFPGDPQGSITQQIAAFVSQEIFPRGDAFVSLHSGGSSLNLLPSAIVEPVLDKAHLQRNIDAVLAFEAPMAVVIGNLGEPRTATAAACRAGLVTVATELAGAGTVSPDALDICRRGVRNVLSHFGVLPPLKQRPRPATPLYELPGSSAFVYASSDGVFEPLRANGSEVKAGEPAGRIHFTWDPERPPDTLVFGVDGIVFGHRQPGRVAPGNCCAIVAAPYGG